MTWGNYQRCCLGHIQKDINKWRHTRSILSALSGKDGRYIIELPGDFNHIPKQYGTESNIKELQKHGLYDLLKNLKNVKGSNNNQ